MAFQSVPNCAEAVINCTYGGKAIANVLNFVKSGGYNATDIGNLADAVDDAVGNLYLPVLSDGVAYVSTLVRGLELINDLTQVVTTSAGAGAVTGGPFPANVSLCITLRSGLTGRSARGRFYAMPTGISNQSATNTFSSTYVGDVEDFLIGVRSSAAGQGWNMCIVSRRTLNAARPVGVNFLVASIGARNNTMDSQRGRLPAGH